MSKSLSHSYAADAREWANILVRQESRGPGDIPNAMRRLEARYGIPWRVFWSLRYRPGNLLVDTFFQLRGAYEAECERQLRLVKHELEITKAKAGANSAAVAEGLEVKDSVGYLLGKNVSRVENQRDAPVKPVEEGVESGPPLPPDNECVSIGYV